MGKVIWSEAALADADSIVEYVARDSADRAALLAARLVEATDQLTEFPQCGRVIPEFENPLLREIVVGSYRILYRIEGPNVRVTRVFHGARKRPAP